MRDNFISDARLQKGTGSNLMNDNEEIDMEDLENEKTADNESDSLPAWVKVLIGVTFGLALGFPLVM